MNQFDVRRIVREELALAGGKWRDISTAPELAEGIYWTRPGTVEDGKYYCDTSGNPILSNCKPQLFFGKNRCWSSLMVATHWMPYPEPPDTSGAVRDE